MSRNDRRITAAGARKAFAAVERIYLFHGTDEIEMEAVVRSLRDRVVDASFADFDSEYLDATSATPDAILAAAGLAPLASERRLVVVRSSDALRRRERQRDADALAAGLRRVGPATCLAFVCLDAPERTRSKTVIGARFDAEVREHGAVAEVPALGEEALLEWIGAEAAQWGQAVAPNAAKRLAQLAAGDRRRLMHDVHKALCHAGDRTTASLEDVEAVAAHDPDDVAFRLVDAIGRRRVVDAMRLLDELLRFEQRVQPAAGRLLSLVGRQMRLLWQASELAALGYRPSDVRNLPPEVVAELPTEGSIVSLHWKCHDIFAMAKGWTGAELQEAFDAILRCDLANKGGGTGGADVAGNLRVLLVRLCSTSDEPGGRAAGR
ncbi:MAG TPA: DNA polymerase III subunit delta [Chthonomonadales bacterium]|nr:DNA polymerase III subunit delta [Chthonomonadales bacterium]